MVCLNKNNPNIPIVNDENEQFLKENILSVKTCKLDILCAFIFTKLCLQTSKEKALETSYRELNRDYYKRPYSA